MKEFTEADVNTLNDIMEMQDSMKQRQAEVREAIAELAKRLETKPARVNTVMRIYRKEKAEPGTIEFEQATLDAAIAVAR